MKNNKGFTLIELLVVVAIIGILSSVVLASLNTARAKGSDAALKSNLSNLRAQAELLYDANGAYAYTGTAAAAPKAAGDCIGTDGATAPTAGTLFEDPTILQGIKAARSAVGGTVLNACMSTLGSASSWSVGVQMKSNPLKIWCADSSGQSKEVIIAAATQANVTAAINESATVAKCD